MLKVWEGAGYYARARNLHRAAQEIVHRAGGTLPDEVLELKKLPGLGRYTARAIGAIGFGVPVVALETNGLRVATRLTLTMGDPRKAEHRSSLLRWLQARLPKGAASDFNEALMELGQTICLPRRPRCPICPVAEYCRARRELPDPGVIPSRRARPPRPHVRAAVVALEWNGRWLVQRRPSRALLGGLWEFPGGKAEPGESAASAAHRELKEEIGARTGRLKFVGTIHHAYSHFTVQLSVFTTKVLRRPRVPRTVHDVRWISPNEFAKLPRPKATEKAARLIMEFGRQPETASQDSKSRADRRDSSFRATHRPRESHAPSKGTAP